jgi:hypothetical protein
MAYARTWPDDPDLRYFQREAERLIGGSERSPRTPGRSSPQ